MKINKFTALLAFLFAAVISYFMASHQTPDNQILLGFGSLISLFLTGVGAVSLSFEYDRTSTLTRTSSFVFFGLLLLSQIIFTNINFKIPTYILVNGLLVILFLWVTYFISKSKH